MISASYFILRKIYLMGERSAAMENGEIRKHWEELEKQTLSPHAVLAVNSRGRERPVEECPLRTCFVRDRDRIIHCKSFRRLKHKTQVFLAPRGDHYRTRLTHTLEVSQIARTIARALRLNEDLTEAMALGHDLGHTPFGHAGEAVLNQLVPGGFVHSSQSLRVVDKLEKDGRGLNLTWEVRDGIVNHSRHGHPGTVEGQVLCLSDQIAYVNHDIDDAIRAGVLKAEEIPLSCRKFFGETHSKRINSMISDIVSHCANSERVDFTPQARERFEELRSFMFSAVYFNPVAKGEEDKAKYVVEQLYRHYLHHVEELPEEFLLYREEDGEERIAADFIACMTDTYAIADYQRLFVPKAWN